MWREFKYEVVGGSACRLLRWLSRDAVTGGFVGEVGLARGYSEVGLTHSRLPVTALHAGHGSGSWKHVLQF